MSYVISEKMKELGRAIEQEIAELENENRKLQDRIAALEKKTAKL